MKAKARKITSIICVVSLMMTFFPTYTMAYETNSSCVLYAESSEIGAINIEANNICINGNLRTKGTAAISGNLNLNGSKNEYIDMDMLYFTDDYLVNSFHECKLEKLDCLIDLDNVNGNNMVIASKYGDIIIDASNVSFNGLIYAPFGKVTINADNINLNGVIIISKEVEMYGNTININSLPNYEDIIINASTIVDIPIEDWDCLSDDNDNDGPDVLEDVNMWYKYLDSDYDKIPDIVEKYYNLDYLSIDTDGDSISDYCEIFTVLTDPLSVDSDGNGIDDGDEDFDGDLLTNIEELQNGTNPYFCDDETKLDVQEYLCEDEELSCDGDEEVVYDEESEYGISLLAVSDEKIYSRVLSIDQFREESRVIVEDVEEYLDDYDIASLKTVRDTEEDFVNRWNIMANDTDRNYVLCVVNCHGSPYSMYNGINKDDIEDLEEFDCDLVVLLGCNCGHTDAIWSNVAYHLSKKVTGIVVASDGTVSGSIQTKWFFNDTATFKSKADDTFDEICVELSGDERNNNGWVIYKYNSKKKVCTWYTTNLKTITVETLLDYLVKCDMFDY